MDNTAGCSSPFINLGSYATNFASFIKNFTSTALYGIASNGNTFTLLPATYYGAVSNGIYVESHVIQDPSGRIDTLCNKSYRAPIQNSPVYIEEHNCLLFISAEDRDKCIALYGSGAKIVKAYMSGTVSTLNASFKAITCLNTNRDFYTIGNNGIMKVPSLNEETCEEYLRKYHIEKACLEVEDVFLINIVLKGVNAEGAIETSNSSYIKRVVRSEMKDGQPIIFEADGMFVFDGRKNAEAFVKKHGTAGNYMLNKALEATHQIHDDELADMNEQAAKDKRGMIETFGMMGATSVASILTENMVKSYNSEDENAVKNAFKLLLIGLTGLASVFGLYKAYRHFSDKSEQEKRNKIRMDLYANDTQ